MLRTAPLLLVVFCTGCTFVVGQALEEAKANIAEGEGDEGEGAEGEEGEGEEGEGEEGEGNEGEGEAVNDNDPACEEDERLLVARDDDGTDVFQVYDLLPGRFRRRTPNNNGANVNLENDDPIAAGNGFSVDSFALGTEGRLYLTGGSFLYQLSASTLTQQNIAAKPQLRASSIYAVQVVGSTIVLSGDTIETIPEGPAVGERPVEVPGQASNYHRSVKFSVDGEDFVAINGEYGYVVLSSVAGAPPTTTVVYDEDFTEVRFHSYGGGTFTPRGIAFDTTTRQLLLGDLGRVIVLDYDSGFSIGDPNDDAGDFVLPNDSDAPVQAIATRGGFAFVLFERGNDNLLKLDLSQSPPVAVAVATVATSSFGRDIAVGCRRVVVAAQNDLIAVSRDDLSPVATNAPGSLGHIAIVKKSALGLAGDD